MDNAIVLLAGGKARRFPRKLEQPIFAGEPMIVRCFRVLRATGWPVYIAANESFAPHIDAALDAPRIIDREPGRGPLAAFVSACAAIAAERVFAVAADQPRLESSVLERLAGAWQTGDETVVPSHDGRIEPLAALYDRLAVLREAPALERDGKSAMRDLVMRLAARYIHFEGAFFYNVNEPADLAAVAQP